jgi:tetratricopeptide (TPR) repeat protein
MRNRQAPILMFWLSLGVSATCLIPQLVRADVESSSKQEKIDRLVDRAALQEVTRAIRTTSTQLAKCRKLKLGLEREEMLLFKLGDLQHQKAELEFRVGMHQKSDQKYRKALEESIRTLTEVAVRFPHTEEMPRLLFLRARANTDLDRPVLAEKDYLRITREFADFDQVDSARVALAAIYTDREDHRQAIDSLKAVRANPASAFHAHALQQIAWAHFNLKQYDDAIEASFDVVRYLRKLMDSKQASITDGSIMERAMTDIATFYGEALEEQPNRYTTAGAWSLFARVHKTSQLDDATGFNPMSIRLAKLLRSKALGKELREWSALLWKERPRLESTVAVDFLLREFSDLQSDWKTSIEIPPFERAEPSGKEALALWEPHRRLYSQIQSRIQDLLKKNPNAPVEKTLPWLERLRQSYISFLAITPDRADPRLAQAEFQLLRAELATLEQKKLRRKFEVVAFSAKSPGKVAEYGPVLARMDSVIPRLSKDQLIPIQLERARLLYEQGERAPALESFEDLLSTSSGGKPTAEARASLAILLDQSILDEDRVRLEKLISRRRDFRQDESALSLIDKAELQRDVLVLKKPRDPSEKAAAIDRLVARRDLPVELGDYALGEKASLLRAEVEPTRLPELLGLLTRQSKPEKNAAPILLLAFSKGEESSWLSKPGFCADAATTALCLQLKALREIEQPLPGNQALALLKQLLKSNAGPDRAVRGMRLVVQGKSLGFKDRGSALRVVAKGWKDLHPVLQWQLLPRWLKASGEMLAGQAKSLRQSSPISVPHQATEAHLVHRMDLIKSFENLARELSEMGLLETALATLDAQIAITADFAEDVGKLTSTPGAPAELAALQKGVEGKVAALRKTADEEKAKLSELASRPEPALAPTVPRSFEAGKLPSQVWAFLKSQDWDAATRNGVLARILWTQGARHAASRL